MMHKMRVLLRAAMTGLMNCERFFLKILSNSQNLAVVKCHRNFHEVVFYKKSLDFEFIYLITIAPLIANLNIT